MRERKFDLSAFCDQPGNPSVVGRHRYSIESPWVCDGWEYATDCRIVVRQPSSQPDTDDRSLPSASTMFNRFPRCKKRWPLQTEWFQARCEGCGIVTRAPAPMWIAGRKLAGYYCVAIANLQEVRFSAKRGRDEFLAFVSGSLQGLVMPLSEE